jgi:prolyl-tRNA editing enzyme YbaK/EbsC (Cys-tRNA(Pro) deacylase)
VAARPDVERMHGEVVGVRVSQTDLEGTSMHAKAQHVADTLESLCVRTEVRELESSTRTSQDAAASIGTTVSQIAKSLVFLAGEQPVLVIASGTNRVSLDTVGALLDAELSQSDAKTVKKRTGYSVGGVPPVAHAEPTTVVLDKELFQYETVWAAAGTPHAVFAIAPEELRRVTEGTVADISA